MFRAEGNKRFNQLVFSRVVTSKAQRASFVESNLRMAQIVESGVLNSVIGIALISIEPRYGNPA